MDGGAWWAAVHGVTKSQTRLSDFTFTFHFHALEKEMATHSSILAWRIPGMGEPCGDSNDQESMCPAKGAAAPQLSSTGAIWEHGLFCQIFWFLWPVLPILC